MDRYVSFTVVILSEVAYDVVPRCVDMENMYDSRKHERITTFIVTREKQTKNKLLQ